MHSVKNSFKASCETLYGHFCPHSSCTSFLLVTYVRCFRVLFQAVTSKAGDTETGTSFAITVNNGLFLTGQKWKISWYMSMGLYKNRHIRYCKYWDLSFNVRSTNLVSKALMCSSCMLKEKLIEIAGDEEEKNGTWPSVWKKCQLSRLINWNQLLPFLCASEIAHVRWLRWQHGLCKGEDPWEH